MTEPTKAPDAPEQAPEDKPFEPSGIDGVVTRFMEDQEKVSAKAAASTEPPEKKEEGTATQAGAPTPPEKKPTLRLVNEKGEVILDRFKSDGKEIFLDDPEAVKTWLGFGHHHNVRGEELKTREEALQKEVEAWKQANPLMADLYRALQEGRIRKVEPGEKPPAVADPKKEPEVDLDKDDDFADPAMKALKAEVRESRKALAKTQEELTKLRDAYNVKEIEKVTHGVKAAIEKAKETYKFADDDQVWTFLAEQDATGKPTYATEEAAVKKSHELQVAKFKGWLEAEHPEFTEVSESKRQKIIAEYLEAKASKEAPVGKPSPIPAGAPEPKERKFRDLSEAVQAGFKEIFGGKEAADKS